MTDITVPLVDVHAHFVTDHYVELAKAAGFERPDGMPGWPTWSVEGQLALMSEARIQKSMLSISSPGVHWGDDAAARSLAREVNNFGAAVRSEYPERFGHWASLPLPDVEGSLAELAYALDDLGSDGVALETNMDGRYLGDPGFEPLWNELDRRSAVVLVHPTSPHIPESVSLGRPRPMLEFIFDSARTVADLVFAGVLERHPNIRWLFTHGGGALPLLADRMELFRTTFASGAPSAASVQEQIGALWFDMAGTPFPNQIPALVRAFGQERLVYGSDSCWTPAAAVLAQVASIDSARQPAGESWRSLTTRNAGVLLSDRTPSVDRRGRLAA